MRALHLADTLTALLDDLDTGVVVWAHNGHVGDARAMTTVTPRAVQTNASSA